MDKKKEHNDTNPAQKVFCHEYVLDWNATRAYQAAYPDSSYDSANANGSRLLVNDSIKAYIEEIQKDIAKLAGISPLSQVLELKKLAYSDMSSLFEDWVSLEDFDKLTDEQKGAILEISYSKKKIGVSDVDIEFVKVKLHDKMAAIREINKMLGFHAPEKKDVTSGGEPIKGISPIEWVK
jgi:phage terminase small subunit